MNPQVFLAVGVWFGGVIFFWWFSDVAYGAHWILGLPTRLLAIAGLIAFVLAAPAMVLEAGRAVLGKSDLRPLDATALAVMFVAGATVLVSLWLSGRL